MKRFAIIGVSIALSMLSSCALFIVSEDNPPRNGGDDDSISITITHVGEVEGQAKGNVNH
jgi:hypothetical protein